MNVKEFMDALAASPLATQIDQPGFVDTGKRVPSHKTKEALDEWERDQREH